MNPISHAVPKVGLPAMRDVMPRAKPQPPVAAAPKAATAPALIKPELVEVPFVSPSVPKPAAAVQAFNPISQAKPIAETAKEDDNDLDRILKDVNTSVKQSENKIEKK